MQTSLDGPWLLLTQEWCCCSNQFRGELGAEIVVSSLDVAARCVRAQGFHAVDAGLSMLVRYRARARL